MRILMYRWKAYNYRDIEQTFRLLGHTVDNIEQELGNYDIDPEFEAKIEAMMEKKHYDMVFTVNYFALISNSCQKMGVKYVSWTCDNPLISMYHVSVFNDCNYIFTFDKTNYLEFKEMGVKHIWYLPLAVDVDRIDMILQKSEDSVKYRGDIAFVGSLYERNSYDKIKNRLPEYLRGYFDAAMLAQLNIYGDNIIDDLLTVDILKELSEIIDFRQGDRAFSDIRLVFESTFLGFKLANIERVSTLNRLSKTLRGHNTAVYTDTIDSKLEGVDYRGAVAYMTHMPLVFNNSRINLNMTIRNIRTGIPLRVWDILGAGGFLLTNFQVELPDYFENGKDIVYYEDINDCCRKAEYYLSHEDERRLIALNGYNIVKQKHSYIQRIATILDIVNY